MASENPFHAAGCGDRVARLLDAVEITGPAGFRFAGEAPVAVPVAPGADPARALRDALANVLYARGYTQDHGGPADTDPGAAALPPGSLLPALQAANPTPPGWDPGWKVLQPGTAGALTVTKGDTARLVQPGQYAFAVPGRLPAAGEVVSLQVVNESLLLQPGFYHAFSSAFSCDYDRPMLARLYVHARAAEAPWLLAQLGGTLNRYRVPFQLKCLLDPAGYDRADPFVVYLARRHLPAALRLLAPLAGEIAKRLRPTVPLFAKPLLPGLSGADDPGTGESFGQSRCALLADGLLDAWRAGATGTQGKLDAVAARFRAAGLNPAAPHLNAGLADFFGPLLWQGGSSDAA